MDVLTGMRVFHAVVDSGSFTAASEKLDMSPAMVTRYVAQLESHLGARLMHRTTRKLSLTGIGADYFQRSVHILGLVEEAGLRAAQEATEPRGVLRVTAPSVFGFGILDRAVVAFMQKYPQVEVDLSISQRPVDLVEEGFDVAVRVAPRPDIALVSRTLMRVPMVTCASAAYLKKHGTPRTPQDLERHNCLLFTRSPLGTTWLYERKGRELAVKVAGTLRADAGEVLVAAAVEGVGLIYEPQFLVEGQLKARRLQHVLADWDTLQIDVAALWPTRKFLHPKVRCFVDFLAERFAN